MSIAWSDVTNHFAALSAVGAAAQADILAYANGDAFDDSALSGTTLKLARIYLAAHMGWASRPGSSGDAGPVTSESAGGLSRSYAVLADASTWGSTEYGRRLQGLLRRALGGPAVV